MASQGEHNGPLRSVEDLQPLLARIPYARTLGFSIQRDGSDLIGRMAYHDELLGNVRIGALHGGTLGALMEFTALCKLMTLVEQPRVPKTINITVEYLRSAQRSDTFARATVTRHGRRIANVRIVAYQDEPQRPVAAATAHFLLTV
jgi:uncharacterized protein (TIGR00369 family)